MPDIRAAILRNEDPSSGKKWALACEKLGIEHHIIDLTAADWMSQISAVNPDLCLLRPPGMLRHFKALYDERMYIVSQVLGLPTYPSFTECYIYENKPLLSDYLQAKGIPHPQTHVFYDQNAALAFANTCPLPVVAKTSIGASGSGVQVIRQRGKALQHVKKAFSPQGIKRRYGPNRVTGSPRKWLAKALKSPSYFLAKLKEYAAIHQHGERGFVLFQEYIPHDFEWRAVKIGASYFAHQKIKYRDMASGSKGIDYVAPRLGLMDFARNLCETNDFSFMAVDLFEDGKGGYLVNELQTIFGHVQDHIMEVNGKPGRYLHQNGRWVFEEGDFNTNESYDLRLQTAIALYECR
jgi:glutathione synthase/RimK-type ligase-like ATP-grasp enzyme